MCLRLNPNNKKMNYKTIKEAAHEYFRKAQLMLVPSGSEYGFMAGVEYATNWNKINIDDIKTFPEENEPVLIKDGEWLFVGVRHGCVFFTDVENIEITNDIEWRLINFK